MKVRHCMTREIKEATEQELKNLDVREWERLTEEVIDPTVWKNLGAGLLKIN